MGPATLAKTTTPDLPVAPTTSEMVSMFERLATNPDVNVEKLERLIAMQERILAHTAKAAFDAAFSKLQSELPEISERGQIIGKTGGVRSTYAKLEDIHAAVKPILKLHGFAIRHRTEWPVDKPGVIRVVGILSHTQGHSEESAFEAPMDRSDFRTDIQSMGSTVSYGRRYTTLDLLNLVTRGIDTDGQAPRTPPAAPAGYDAWLDGLTAVADEGLQRLEATWNGSKREFREYLTRYDPQRRQALKTRASRVVPR
jgi:hypothetical protein